MKRVVVLGLGVLVLGYAAGCGGSEPAAPQQTPPPAATPSGAPAAQPSAAAAPDGASSITGTITYAGKVPSLPPLTMNADPACEKLHAGKPAPNEMLVLGSDNSMANILV